MLVGDEGNDVESLLDNGDSEVLLSIVSSVSHESVGDSLDDGAGGLSESFLLVSSGSVGNVDVGLGGVDGDQVSD